MKHMQTATKRDQQLIYCLKIDNVFTGRPLVWVTYRPPAPSPGCGVVQSSVPLLGALLTASALLCSPSLALASLDQPSHACTLTFSDQRVLNQSLLLLYNSGTVSSSSILEIFSESHKKGCLSPLTEFNIDWWS